MKSQIHLLIDLIWLKAINKFNKKFKEWNKDKKIIILLIIFITVDYIMTYFIIIKNQCFFLYYKIKFYFFNF